MTTKPNIFDYNDFRIYLKDYYAYRHALDKKFSKAIICKQLGLPNSRSYFQDVLNGKFVSNLKVPLLIKLLKLTKEEALYFKVLVNFNQAVDDPDERDLFFEKLISLNRTPKSQISSDVYSYYREWYHSVVRAVLNIYDFSKDGNHSILARQVFPSITEKKAKTSVQLLLDLGLIHEDSSGFLKPTDKVITTGAFAQDELIKQYQLKALEIAKEAILKNKKQPQRVITKMISISEEGLKRIEKHIEKFNAEITSIVHKDEMKADRVYQLDIIFYPHSKEVKSWTQNY
jgi:uncharacterized protein (TIGR02147 family)